MAKRNQQTAMRKGDRLDERLNDYSAVTRISAAAKSVRGRAGNWPVYAAAAGSALAMATNASASIIYCGATNNYCESVNQHPNPTAASNQQVIIPLVQSTLSHRADSHHLLLSEVQGSAIFGGASLLGVKVAIFDTGANVKNFASRAPIGSQTGLGTSLEGQGLVRIKSSSRIFGNFAPGVSGIAGFEIVGVGSQHNQNDYGWIRLLVNGNEGGYPVSLTAVDWAFDTTGDPIGAGVTSPEPGTMGLGLLALGAAGIAALKRRRSQTPA